MWKFPRRMQFEAQTGSYPADLTNEKFDEVMRGKLKSTYQQDFLGLPQGYSIKSAFTEPMNDPKSKAKYTLDSTSRETYQVLAYKNIKRLINLRCISAGRPCS